MLATAAMTTPIFNFDFSSHQQQQQQQQQPSLPPAHPAGFSRAAAQNRHQHRPVVSSPLSSSPLRVNLSQSSPPQSPSAGGRRGILSPRDPNALPPRQTQSSPLHHCGGGGGESSSSFMFNDGSNDGPPIKQPLFKFASRPAKPNPLRPSQSQGGLQAGRRRQFLDNVRQRRQDREWQRRGGDQEALKMEWSALSRRRREQMDADIDGLVFEDDLEDIPEEVEFHGEDDEAMADVVAREEERELEAMLSMMAHQEQSPTLPPMSTSSAATGQQVAIPSRGPDSSFLPSDDDDYDNLFMDLISPSQNSASSGPGSQDFACSGEMDLS